MLSQAKLYFDLTNIFFYLVDVNADYYPLNLFRYFTGKVNNTLYLTPSYNIFKNTLKIFFLVWLFCLSSKLFSLICVPVAQGLKHCKGCGFDSQGSHILTIQMYSLNAL